MDGGDAGLDSFEHPQHDLRILRVDVGQQLGFDRVQPLADGRGIAP